MGLVIKLVLVLELGAGWNRGYAARYDPGVMESAAYNRGMPIVSCMVSSPVYPLGTWVYIQGLNTGKILLCRVTDVSADVDTSNNPKSSGLTDRQRHIRDLLWAELGYLNTVDICGSTKLPNRQCPIMIHRMNDNENNNKNDSYDTGNNIFYSSKRSSRDNAWYMDHPVGDYESSYYWICLVEPCQGGKQ